MTKQEIVDMGWPATASKMVLVLTLLGRNLDRDIQIEHFMDSEKASGFLKRWGIDPPPEGGYAGVSALYSSSGELAVAYGHEFDSMHQPVCVRLVPCQEEEQLVLVVDGTALGRRSRSAAMLKFDKGSVPNELHSELRDCHPDSRAYADAWEKVLACATFRGQPVHEVECNIWAGSRRAFEIIFGNPST